MTKYNNLNEEIDKKYARKDDKRKKKMKVTGKSVFGLKKIIDNKKK